VANPVPKRTVFLHCWNINLEQTLKTANTSLLINIGEIFRVFETTDSNRNKSQ
jgi:hypothetical protein